MGEAPQQMSITDWLKALIFAQVDASKCWEHLMKQPSIINHVCVFTILMRYAMLSICSEPAFDSLNTVDYNLTQVNKAHNRRGS